jgi:glycosyltransferase involved in cell wall biosynthesis
MRITILADIPWPRGAAGSVRVGHWAAALARSSCEVTVLPIGHYGPCEPIESDVGFTVVGAARFRSRYGIFSRSGIDSIRRIGSAAAQSRPDWVLCYGRRLSTIAACVAMIPVRTPIALDVVEHPSITLWERGVASPAAWDHRIGFHLLARRARVIFAITPKLANACRRWTSAPIEIVGGLTAPPTDERRVAGPRFGYFGTWHEKDGPAFMAKVVAAAMDADPKLTFETVGVLPDRARFELQSLGIQGARMHHHGAVPDALLPSVLSSWRIALLPRANERSVAFAFPNRVADLLSAGTPVAVRKNIGVSGLGPADGIVLIDSTDPQAAGREIAGILKSKDRIAELRAAAFRCARESLEADRVVGRALALMTAQLRVRRQQQRP